MSTQKVHSGTAGKTEKCLSPETLSASLDGEYSFTEEEVSHLQSCTKCKNLYESYKLLDDVLSHTLDVRCPPASLNRIRKKVAYHTGRSLSLPEDSKHGFDFIAWSFRASAMLALLGVASFLIWKGYVPKTEGIQKKSITAQLPPSGSGTGENRNRILAQDGRQPAMTGFGSVDIRALNLVAAGNNHPLEFVDSASALQNSSAAGRRVETIGRQVDHLWIFDAKLKAASVEKLFRDALKKAQVPLNRIKWDLRKDGTLRADMELTRYQAVLLVRILAAEKLMLLNSAQPQPEQRLFAGSGKELVRYKVLLIPRSAVK